MWEKGQALCEGLTAQRPDLLLCCMLCKEESVY